MKLRNLFGGSSEVREEESDLEAFRQNLNDQGQIFFDQDIAEDIESEVEGDIEAHLTDIEYPSLIEARSFGFSVTSEQYVNILANMLEDGRTRINEFSEGYLNLRESEFNMEDIVDVLAKGRDEIGESLVELAETGGFENSPVENEAAINQIMEGRETPDQSILPETDAARHLKYLSGFLDEEIETEGASAAQIHDPEAGVKVANRHTNIERARLTKKALKQMGSYKRVSGVEEDFIFLRNNFPVQVDGVPITFTGGDEEWEAFNQNIAEDTLTDLANEDIKVLSSLGAEIETVESLEDLRTREKRARTLLSSMNQEIDNRFEEAVKRTKDYPATSPVPTAHLIQKYISEVPKKDWIKKKRVESFGETLSELSGTKIEVNGQTRDAYELFLDRLGIYNESFMLQDILNEDIPIEDEVMTDIKQMKFGNKMIQIASDRNYEIFLENEDESILELLKGEKEIPEAPKELSEIESDFEGFENWNEVLEYALSENSDILSNIMHVTSEAGEDFEPDRIGWITGKYYQKKNTEHKVDVDPDPGQLAKDLEKEVRKAMPEKYRKAIRNLGKQKAEDLYRSLTSAEEANIDDIKDWELAALKVYKRSQESYDRRWEEAQETVEKLMEYGNQVYEELGENLAWIQEHNLEVDKLLDPALEGNKEYSEVESHRKESALKVELSEEEVELDIEEDKDRIWEEEIERYINVLEGHVPDYIDRENPKTVQRYIKEKETEKGQNQTLEALRQTFNDFISLDEIIEGVPDSLTMYVSSPTEKMLMGEGFPSCHRPEGSHAWAAAENSVSPNSIVIYAEDDEGVRRGRTKLLITEREDLVYFNTNRYKNAAINMSEPINGYMKKISNELDMELKHVEEIDYNLEEEFEMLERQNMYLGE